jgi:hypothetical protein
MKTTKGRRRLKQSRSSSRFGLPLDRVTVGRDQDERLIASPCGGLTTATRGCSRRSWIDSPEAKLVEMT